MKIKTSELSKAALDWAVAKCEGYLCDYKYGGGLVSYSTDWAHGGPIIEREGIELQFDLYRWNAASGVMRFYIGGATPLIAAMRCYVALKLGADVEVPDELCQ